MQRCASYLYLQRALHAAAGIARIGEHGDFTDRRRYCVDPGICSLYILTGNFVRTLGEVGQEKGAVGTESGGESHALALAEFGECERNRKIGTI